MNLYIVRHGETVWNLEHRVQGRTDIPLSKRGEEEARDLSELVETLNIEVVIASPLQRTRKTAELLVQGNLPIHTDDRMKERDWGMNEGMPIDEVDQYDCWDVILNTKVQGIEAVQDFMLRVSEFLEEIKVRYPDSNILVVTHNAVVRVVHYLLGTIPEDGDLTRMDVPNLRILEYKI